ncbi:MAG: glycosyltransferase family 2 protein [Candidatus Fermentibacter sp.]|nr:glycosyltransferase family 2 protein [Candidatus Fermentibacter sp.]
MPEYTGRPSEGEGISLFMPAFNEEQNVAFMIGCARNALDALGVPWEIVIVDDGSSDGTVRETMAATVGDERIRVVSHGANRGFGMALRTGIESARMPWVFYTDCDGQFDLDDLGRVWAERVDADVVSAYRRRRRDPGLRLVYSFCYNLIAWIVFFGGFKDVDCSFKLYRRSIFEKVKPRSTCGVIDLEILTLARGFGFRRRQIPVLHRERRAGTVSFETFRKGFFAWVRIGALTEMLEQLFALRVRTWRGDVG